MNVIPFQAHHLYDMRLQEQQAWVLSHVKLADLKTLETVPSYSCFANGECVACAGVVPYWPGRYQAWAYISQTARDNKRVMVHVTRAVKAFLDTLGARRVELAVSDGFEAGHTWAKHLGFVLETPCARKYDIDGNDAAVYVRVS